MKNFIAMAAVAAGMTVAAASANAASFNFVKSGSEKTANCFTFTSDCGTSVTATSDPQCSKVDWSKDGLGVATGKHDSKQISSCKTLWLTFCEPVSIKSITFGDVGGICEWLEDSYKMIDANGCTLSSGQIPGGNWCDTGIGTVNFNCLGPVSKIGLTGLHCGDDFTIRGLETCDSCKPCAVPLPSAAWSGIGMLGLLGAGSMRKRVRRLLTA